MRFLSEAFIRRWFEKRAGGDSEMFQYKSDLASCKRIIAFLPSEREQFFVYLPLMLALAEKRGQNDFLLLADESNRHILRAVDLEKKSILFKNEKVLYGENDFFELERRIKEQKWDVCLFLQEKTTLPFLYLAKISSAPYRMGIKQEFPFLNIALQTAEKNPTAYDYRSFLCKTFGIDEKNAQKTAIHATQKNEKAISDYAHLSTSSTLLLNLEPPINGDAWTADEISTLYKSLQPNFRLIAIAESSERLDFYQNVLDSLDMRSSPVALHSESVFSVLRQYPAIITLNSPHAHLLFNLSSIRVIMINSFEENLGSANAANGKENDGNLLKFSRSGNFYTLSQMIAGFLK